MLKDLVRVIQQESYTYRDPITEFIECLYVHFDFDRAQEKLRECETVLANDFFLVACLEDFIENARLFIFETFCRIHQVRCHFYLIKFFLLRSGAAFWVSLQSTQVNGQWLFFRFLKLSFSIYKAVPKNSGIYNTPLFFEVLSLEHHVLFELRDDHQQKTFFYVNETV